MNAHHPIPASHFSRKTLTALKRKGVAIISMRAIPGVDGTYANGETAYELDDNGTSKLRTFLEVKALAA